MLSLYVCVPARARGCARVRVCVYVCTCVCVCVYATRIKDCSTSPGVASAPMALLATALAGPLRGNCRKPHAKAALFERACMSAELATRVHVVGAQLPHNHAARTCGCTRTLRIHMTLRVAHVAGRESSLGPVPRPRRGIGHPEAVAQVRCTDWDI